MICEICKKEFKQITNSHLVKEHGSNIKEYKNNFPNSPIMSENTRKFLSEKCQKQHENKIGDFGFNEGHKINEGKTPFNKGKTKYDDEGVKKYSEKLKGLKKSENLKKILSEKALDGYRSGNRKKLIGQDNPMWGRKLTEEHRLKLHSSSRSGLKMTKPEIKISQILYDYGFIYTGNREFWLKFLNGKNKNPDFILEGRKIAVEVFGNYWHKDENPNDLIEEYRKIGWDCMVLWECDIMKYGGYRQIIEEFINY